MDTRERTIERVQARIVAWARTTDPAVVRLFWRAGDEAAVCPACVRARPEWPAEGGGGYLGCYVPDRALSRAVRRGVVGGLLERAPDPAEGWYVVCAPCAGGLAEAEREALDVAIGRTIMGVLGRN